jgi:hypothetical protein
MNREHRPEPTTDEPKSIQSIAAEGVAGPVTPLPHAGLIQRAFGRHDISTITAHVGDAATAATDALGANAYARGTSIAFGTSPDLRLAAHEAAHVIQQRHGVAPSGIGTAGDQYEQHADRVAAAVVAGESAEPILDEMVGSSSSGQTHAVQCDPKRTVGSRWPLDRIARIRGTGLVASPTKLQFARKNDIGSVTLWNHGTDDIELRHQVSGHFELRTPILDGVILQPGASLVVEVIPSRSVLLGSTGELVISDAAAMRGTTIALSVEVSSTDSKLPHVGLPRRERLDEHEDATDRQLEAESGRDKRERSNYVDMYFDAIANDIDSVKNGYARAVERIETIASSESAIGKLLSIAVNAMIAGSGAFVGARLASLVIREVGREFVAEAVQSLVERAMGSVPEQGRVDNTDLKARFVQQYQDQLSLAKRSITESSALTKEALYRLPFHELQSLAYNQTRQRGDKDEIAARAERDGIAAWTNFLARARHGAMSQREASAQDIPTASAELDLSQNVSPSAMASIADEERGGAFWGILEIHLRDDMSLDEDGIRLAGVGGRVRDAVRKMGKVEELRVNKVIYWTTNHSRSGTRWKTTTIICLNADGFVRSHSTPQVGLPSTSIPVQRVVEAAVHAQHLSLSKLRSES